MGQLSFSPEATKNAMTLLTGDRYIVAGKLNDIPVALGQIRARIDFIVLPNLLFDVYNGGPTLKLLVGVL